MDQMADSRRADWSKWLGWPRLDQQVTEGAKPGGICNDKWRLDSSAKVLNTHHNFSEAPIGIRFVVVEERQTPSADG
jgi:hypothetical protein